MSASTAPYALGDEIEGVRIVAVAPADSPLGNGVKFRRVLALTLADNATPVFGCTECRFVTSTATGVASHVSRAHRADPLGPLADMTLREIVDAAAKFTDPPAKTGTDWKARALDAESKLAQLHKALKGLG